MAPAAAEQTLSEVRRLRNRAKAVAHGGAWLPAAVMAALVLLSIALYRVPFSQVNEFLNAFVDSSGWAGLPDPERSALASYLFWLAGTPAAFALIGIWYRWHASRTGMRVPWRWFAVTGLVTLAALVALAAVPVDPQTATAANRFLADRPDYSWLLVLRTPLVPIAAAVMVLGWVERSRFLAVAGGWIGLVVWWQGYFGMGRIPGWMGRLLAGGEGPALGGEITTFGLNRPGPVLILATLPLIVFAAARAARSGGPR
jgi:hypothetical protein